MLKINDEETQKLIPQGLGQGKSVKLLGISLDDKVSWSAHIDNNNMFTVKQQS